MKKILIPRYRLLFLFVLALTLSYGVGAKAADNPGTGVITDIKLDDNTIVVKGDKPFTFTLFSGNDPYRVTLEIPDMRVGQFSDRIASTKAGITEIIPKQNDSPGPSVKMEIVLQNPSSVVPSYIDGELKLQIKAGNPAVLTGLPSDILQPQPAENEDAGSERGNEKPSIEDQAEKEHNAVSEESAKAKEDAGVKQDEKEEKRQAAGPKATEVSSIEINKSAQRMNISIKGNGSMTPNVFPLKERIVIDIPGVVMKASLPKGFTPPLQSMRIGKYREKTRIVLDLKTKTDFEVASGDKTIEISLKTKSDFAKREERSEEPSKKKPVLKTVLDDMNGSSGPEKPIAKAEVASVTEKADLVPEVKKSDEAEKSTGQKISLDFQDAEVGQLIRLLSDMRKPQPYNLVLDPSVKGKRIPNLKLMNVGWNQALDIICKSADVSYRLDGNVLWIAPQTMFSKLEEDRKKARETEEQSGELLQEIVRVNYANSGEIQAAITQGKLLTPRGSITVDSRMNTLIVKDTARSIEKIRELVRVMDVSKPQVMIEAKIVQVSSKFTQNLGIKWGGTFYAPVFPNVTNGTFSVNTPTTAAGPATSNPGGTVNMTIGNANTFNVNMSLSALETINKAKTLANPKILTIDNEAANIQQGTTFFIPTVSQAGTQSQPQSATLSLQVTPKITPDGYVQIKVQATNNSLEQGTAGASAVVDTQSLSTQALVKNGETLVLGGIYQKSTTEAENQVPLLNRLPILGWLFKTKQSSGPDVTELLIFITPTILTQTI